MSAAWRLLWRLEESTGYEVRRQAARHRAKLLDAHGVDLVLDVGAATGRYGVALRRAGYKGAIASFEPLSAPFVSLQAAANSDRAWTAHQVALGAEAGTAEINVAGNSDSSSLLPMLDRHREVAPHANYVGTEKIIIRTLDEVWSSLPAAERSFLKIDTQGFEGQVLDGATRVLPKVAGVQLELSFVPLYAGGLTYDQAIVRMRDAGFVPMGVEPGVRDKRTSQMLQADVLFFRA